MERLCQLVPPSPVSAGPLWVILMLRGGHFAAAVLRAKAPLPARGGGGGGAGSSGRSLLDPAAEPFEVVDHKTFHRYVVRCGGWKCDPGDDLPGQPKQCYCPSWHGPTSLLSALWVMFH